MFAKRWERTEWVINANEGAMSSYNNNSSYYFKLTSITPKG